MTKHAKTLKNSIFVERVQATPICQPSQMPNKEPLDVQSADHLTIVILDLLEINIQYTL